MTWCAAWTTSPSNPQSTYWPSGIAGWPFRAIGNPLNDDTWTYTWQNGRQLSRMQSVDIDASFVYNENGLRVQKTVNGIVTDYTLHGKNVVHMKMGNDELHFFYDASNKPAVVVYNGVPHSYVKNLQGDIVAILDSNKNVVVSYVYDAWGRPISCSGTMANTLGKINPFRYRGYVYDEETGLYYLRSRYYNAHKCRFINADALINGNLYAYCENSPIVHKDNNGYALCCCFDDNGFETTLMSHFMFGGSCRGGSGSSVGGVIVGNHLTELQDEIELAAKETVDTMVQFSVVLSMPSVTLIAVALHYNRNAINISYTEYELTKVMNYLPESTSSDKFHQNNQIGGRNRKYVVNPGWFSGELVFYSDGSLNDTPEDRGTVNVYSGNDPVLNVVVHGLFDVVPYMIFGNAPDDSTTIIDRIQMIFK